MNVTQDIDLLLGFVEEAKESLAGIPSLFVALEKNPKDVQLLNAIFRPLHTIKGNSGFLKLEELKQIAHHMENVMDRLRRLELTCTREIVSDLLLGVDIILEHLNQIASGNFQFSQEGKINAYITSLNGYVNSPLASATLESPEHSAKQEHPVNPEAPATTAQPADSSQAVSSTKSMRVAENLIDSFLEKIGELIIIGEAFEYLRRRINEVKGFDDIAREFRRLNETFSSLSGELEKSVMTIRKVSAKTILSKVPRIVRDVANATGKLIEIEVSGEELLIDKSLIENLEGPLVHMVRNAADHGIEKPQLRRQLGKPEIGKVAVHFFENEDGLVMRIQDDGQGLDLEAIWRKVVELKMISEHETLSKEALIDFLFQAGVSTAKVVTEISGRGVGMDVVKKNIDSMGGKIDVQTERGKGSVFSLQLPKSITTQIIQSFVFKVGEQHYVIPVKCVLETSSYFEVTRVYGQAPMVQKFGEFIAVVNLRTKFGFKADEARREDQDALVFVKFQEHKLALQVDAILGIQQIVVKNLHGLNIEGELFSGAALMGDGRVSLLLNLKALVVPSSAGLN